MISWSNSVGVVSAKEAFIVPNERTANVLGASL